MYVFLNTHMCEYIYIYVIHKYNTHIPTLMCLDHKRPGVFDQKTPRIGWTFYIEAPLLFILKSGFPITILPSTNPFSIIFGD